MSKEELEIRMITLKATQKFLKDKRITERSSKGQNLVELSDILTKAILDYLP